MSDPNTSESSEVREIRINPVVPSESVLVATARGMRPKKAEELAPRDTRKHVETCPFCRGNEHKTPPLILRWPDHVPAGLRVAQPVSTKDIGATVLALVGQTSRPFPGRSLAELWDGQANASHWPLPISELAQARFDPDFPNYYGPLNSIVTPTLQYIIDPREGKLLYAWPKDRGEVNNLAHDPSYAGVLSQLQAELQAELHAWPRVLTAADGRHTAHY